MAAPALDPHGRPGRLPGGRPHPRRRPASSYAASVAVDRALRAHGVHPRFAVGQSFGEIAALVCAGAFSIADGARMGVAAVGVLARHGGGGGMGLLEAGEDRTLACIEAAAPPRWSSRA
ncbi:hypothetical protein ACFQY7_10640 [Actinomadura luteofluorescens]|uniref:hypothetical protein n=1 Tax=Actinomadura luteofluorescens TaxID=46163 RepID=UPI003630044A